MRTPHQIIAIKLRRAVQIVWFTTLAGIILFLLSTYLSIFPVWEQILIILGVAIPGSIVVVWFDPIYVWIAKCFYSIDDERALIMDRWVDWKELEVAEIITANQKPATTVSVPIPTPLPPPPPLPVRVQPIAPPPPLPAAPRTVAAPPQPRSVVR